MSRMRKTRLGGGLAARYGTAPRRRYIDVLSRMRRFHECPRCKVRAAKRVSVGLWECRKCGHQFTGGAYVPFTKTGDVAKRSVGATIRLSAEAEIPTTSPSLEVPLTASDKPKRKLRRKKTSVEVSKEEAK